MTLSLFAVLFACLLLALRALSTMCTQCVSQLVADALPMQPLPNGHLVKVQAMRAGPTHGTAEREGREQDTSQQDTSQGLGWPHTKAGGESTCERPCVRRLKDGKAVVPSAARAPHSPPPPCRLSLGPRDEVAHAPVVQKASG